MYMSSFEARQEAMKLIALSRNSLQTSFFERATAESSQATALLALADYLQVEEHKQRMLDLMTQTRTIRTEARDN